MKKILLLISLLLPAVVSLAQLPQAALQQQTKQVEELIRTGDWFALDRLPPEVYEALPKILKLQTEAFLGSYFNDLPRSCKAIETLLNEYPEQLDDSTHNTFFSLLLGNLRMMGEYRQAAKLTTLLEETASDSTSRVTLNGLSRWFEALAQYPKTHIARPEGEVSLPLHIVRQDIRDALGNPKTIETLFTDVKIGDTTEPFIFDTGCSQGSFVSEAFARKHNIRIICDSILASGVAGNGYVRAGILDSMCIGLVTIYNPTFLIAPPNEATDTLYQVNAVLGTDFMNITGELQLYPRQGRMVIPAKESPMPEAGRNLFLKTMSGQYSVVMTCDGEPVSMVFDTGSMHTMMHVRWFERNKDRILAEGSPKEIGFGGFGGIARGRGYTMPALRLNLGRTGLTMHNVNVDSELKDGLDGWLGVDFFLSFGKVTIDLPRMFVTVE